MSRHRQFLKIGLRVKYRLPNGATVVGRVDGNDLLSNGVWTSVNVAPKGENRTLKRVRPSQLTPA